ncbi:MAG: metal-sensitive transcriptional regulator [Chthoniobacteraceae bacterium]
MDQPIDQHGDEIKALTNRIRRVTGQLNGIERMLNEDHECTEILAQVVSARRALKSFAEKLIHSHIHHCIEEARDQADAKKKLRDLLTVLERYVE